MLENFGGSALSPRLISDIFASSAAGGAAGAGAAGSSASNPYPPAASPPIGAGGIARDIPQNQNLHSQGDGEIINTGTTDMHVRAITGGTLGNPVTTTITLKPGQGIVVEYDGETDRYGYTITEQVLGSNNQPVTTNVGNRRGGSGTNYYTTRPTEDHLGNGMTIRYSYPSSQSTTSQAATSRITFPDGSRQMTMLGSVSGYTNNHGAAAMEAAYALGVRDVSSTELDTDTLSSLLKIVGSTRGGIEAIGEYNEETLKNEPTNGYAIGNSNGIIVTDQTTPPSQYYTQNEQGFIVPYTGPRPLPAGTNLIDAGAGHAYFTDPIQCNIGGSRIEYDGTMSVSTETGDSAGTIDYSNSLAFTTNGYNAGGTRSFIAQGTDSRSDSDSNVDHIEATQFGYSDSGRIDQIVVLTYNNPDDFNPLPNGNLVIDHNNDNNFGTDDMPAADSGVTSRSFTVDSNNNINLITLPGNQGSVSVDYSTGNLIYIDGQGNVRDVDEAPGYKGDIGQQIRDMRADGSIAQANSAYQTANPSGSAFFGTSQFFDRLAGWVENPFSGLAGYSQLFGWADQTWYRDYANAVRDFFCTSIVLSNIDCWISTLCTLGYSDELDPGEGTVFTTDPITGALIAVAHIEGERGPPVMVPNASAPGGRDTFYTYKISFFINDVKDEDEQGTDADISFVKNTGEKVSMGTISLVDGDSYGLGGMSMQVFFSKNFYTKMRIDFDPPIPSYYTGIGRGLTEDIEYTENDFVEVGQSPTSVAEAYSQVGGDPSEEADSGTTVDLDFV